MRVLIPPTHLLLRLFSFSVLFRFPTCKASILVTARAVVVTLGLGESGRYCKRIRGEFQTTLHLSLTWLIEHVCLQKRRELPNKNRGGYWKFVIRTQNIAPEIARGFSQFTGTRWKSTWNQARVVLTLPRIKDMRSTKSSPKDILKWLSLKLWHFGSILEDAHSSFHFLPTCLHIFLLQHVCQYFSIGIVFSSSMWVVVKIRFSP